MENMDRRLVLALGVASSALVLPTVAAAQTYGPDEGKELAPGVRQVDLGEGESVLPGYKMLKLRDIVIQPGAKTPDNVMKNDYALPHDRRRTCGRSEWQGVHSQKGRCLGLRQRHYDRRHPE